MFLLVHVLEFCIYDAVTLFNTGAEAAINILNEIGAKGVFHARDEKNQ